MFTSLFVSAMLSTTPAGSFGHTVPPAVPLMTWTDASIVKQQDTRPPRKHGLDIGLAIISITGSAVANGITAGCTSIDVCHEVVPLMSKWIKDSLTKAVLAKSAISGGIHFLILRYMPEGKIRTLTLGLLAGINWFDAGHDIKVMRQIVRERDR